MTTRRDERIREMTPSNSPALSKITHGGLNDKNRLDSVRLQAEMRLENARRESMQHLYKCEEKEVLKMKERLDKCKKEQSVSHADLLMAPMSPRRASLPGSRSSSTQDLSAGSPRSNPSLTNVNPPNTPLSPRRAMGTEPKSPQSQPRELPPLERLSPRTLAALERVTVQVSHEPVDASMSHEDASAALLARRGRMSLPAISPTVRPASPKNAGRTSPSPAGASSNDSNVSLYVLPPGTSNKEPTTEISPSSPRRVRPPSPCPRQSPRASLTSLMSSDSGICIDSPRPLTEKRERSRSSICSIGTPSVSCVAELEAELELELSLTFRRESV
eukprot:Opistho-1_new@29359